MDGTIGHNSDSGKRLQSYVDRIERLEEEKKALAGDIKEIKEQAVSDGFSKKALNEVLKLRRMSKAEREAFQNDVDLYLNALGMLSDTPLGEAAMERDGFKRPDPDGEVIDLEPLQIAAPPKQLPAPGPDLGDPMDQPDAAE